MAPIRMIAMSIVISAAFEKDPIAVRKSKLKTVMAIKRIHRSAIIAERSIGHRSTTSIAIRPSSGSDAINASLKAQFI
jgi:hypothetical protein